MIDLLIDEGRAIGAITIVPGQNESVKAHINLTTAFRS